MTRFGVVRKCSPRHKPKLKFVVKTISILKLKKRAKDVLEEVFLLKNINHPQISRILKVYKQADKLYVLKKQTKGVNLANYMQEHNRMTETQVASVIRQILEIAKFILIDNIKSKKAALVESQNIGAKPVYRDFKIENFTIDTATHEVFLNDYGVFSTFSDINALKKNIEAPPSLAPECLKHTYQPGCEVWSVGVICYQLLNCMNPYKGAEIGELFHNIVNGHSRLISEKWVHSHRAYDFINNMLGAEVASKHLNLDLGPSCFKFTIFNQYGVKTRVFAITALSNRGPKWRPALR